MPAADAGGTHQAERAPAEQRRMYRELREHTERLQRRRQQLIERLVQQQRERRRRSFRRPSR
jgi:hypothetical protein